MKLRAIVAETLLLGGRIALGFGPFCANVGAIPSFAE
jgi:hypothetical protein